METVLRGRETGAGTVTGSNGIAEGKGSVAAPEKYDDK